MKNYSFLQFLLLNNICLLAILQGIIGGASNCNTLKLGSNQKIIVTIFDNQDKFTHEMWEYVCKAVKQFPKGLITLDYRAGALATGSVDNIQCGGGSCKEDLFNECMLSTGQYFNDCYHETEVDYPKMLRCYCKGDANKILLDNAALRASLNVPEKPMPMLVINQTYDSCIKFGSYDEVLTYFCQVYQKQVGHCGQT